jgi:sugar (pentulose or hexulose) kinase
MKILVMDFGTSSIKFALLDEKYTILRTTKEYYHIRVYNGDWVELDSNVIFSAMLRGIRSLADYGDIDLIAFDNLSPSLVFMDKAGDPLYPIITHLDRRAKKQTKDILDRMGKERFQAITGIQPFTGGASITSVLWIKENEETVFQKAARLGHLNTYIYKKLTDRWYSDPVNASMTGMYETINETDWSAEIIETFDIPRTLLPEVIRAGTTAGYLVREVADICGLRQGIPVALGTNDAASAQPGAGNTQAGEILNISGSSEMISILSAEPRVDERYYLRCSAIPKLWQIYATTASGFALDWFRKEFYRDLSEKEFFEKEFPRVVDNYIDKKTVSFSPYIAGDRQSLEPKKADFSGITLESTREDFLAAILLGIHDPIQSVLKICESFVPLKKRIKLTGGMIDTAFLRVKEKIFPGYQFEIIPDGPIIGSARLALESPDKSQ